MSHRPTALIAEDEPLLAQALQDELARAWPELSVLGVVGDGASAVRQTLALTPQVLFLDIRMPGLGGLEAAAQLAEDWPAQQAFPALVFVTAYDQYAVRAFEAQAVDYLLKPVRPERLRRTVARLRGLLTASDNGSDTRDVHPAGTPQATEPVFAPSMLDTVVEQLRGLLAAAPGPAAPVDARLTVIQAGVGDAIHMVALDDVLYFEAADKYVRVLTATHDYLIRMPLKELLPRLNPAVFWQVHRATVVRAAAIEAVSRDAAGRLSVRLRDRPERLAVSRLHAHLFKAM